MNRFGSNCAALGIGLLQALSSSACARARLEKKLPTQPRPDRSNAVCSALATAKPLDHRFSGILPVDEGGLLATLAGSPQADVQRTLDGLGVLGVSLTHCNSAGLVLFVPGVESDGAEPLFRALRTQLPSLQIRESVILPPQRSVVARPVRD